MLRPRRAKILVAPKPSEAISICEREPVHLLISDLSMPEMNGRKLAERVLELQPEAHVLLISGVFKDPTSEAGHIRFLKKPFFPSQLLAQLKELLPEL